MTALLAAVLLAAAPAACTAANRPSMSGVEGREPQAATRPLAEEPQVKLGEEPADPAVARARAVERAKKRLSEKLDILAAEIELVSVRAVTWSDSSLGCPEPDRMYAQVLVEGHEVVLEAHGKTHELHVSPKSIVVCHRRSTGTSPPRRP